MCDVVVDGLLECLCSYAFPCCGAGARGGDVVPPPLLLASACVMRALACAAMCVAVARCAPYPERGGVGWRRGAGSAVAPLRTMEGGAQK